MIRELNLIGYTVNGKGFKSNPKIGLVELYAKTKIKKGNRWFEHINSDRVKAFNVIKNIVTNCLQGDSNWHFFYEGSYNIIRFSKKFEKKLLTYLEVNGIVYDYKHGVVDWKDGSSIVEEYKVAFIELFHIFSTIALSNYEDEKIYSLTDRIVHCFLNHQHLKLSDQYVNKWGGTTRWEAYLMNYLTANRIFYNGRCEGASEVFKGMSSDD